MLQLSLPTTDWPSPAAVSAGFVFSVSDYLSDLPLEMLDENGNGLMVNRDQPGGTTMTGAGGRTG